MKFAYLADHPEWIPELAQWSDEEWGRFNPDRTVHDTIDEYKKRLHKDKLPLMFVAQQENRPVGCFSIKSTDMTIRPQYSPWLGTVLVAPHLRNRGIGSLLIERALVEARILQLQKLYLWTATAEKFYVKFGFKTIEHLYYKNQDTRVMDLLL